MRTRRLIPVALAAAVIALPTLPATAQRAGAPTLGVDGLPLFRESGSAAVLAVAVDRWKAVSSRSEELLGGFRYLPERASARAMGQVFRVLRTDVPRIASDPGGSIVVVPWSFGPGCAEEGWGTPEWVTPGDTVAFLLLPTRARGRAGKENAVFDVLGWHQPYPVGELIPFWRRTREPNPEWLDAREFYRLLTVLPSRAAFRVDPDSALEPFRHWLQEAPGRDFSFPVGEILAEWEKMGSLKAREGPEGGASPSRRLEG